MDAKVGINPQRLCLNYGHLFIQIMFMLSTKTLGLLLAAAIAVIGPLLFLPMQDSAANYITYRFAAHLAAGRGLLYGTPETAVTTYALVPVLLALASPHLPVAGLILGIIARLACAVLLIRLVSPPENMQIAY